MRWLTSLGLALTARRFPSASAICHEKTESIRAALMETLNGAATPDALALIQRIRYASDAQRLWYLRPEVMSALASLHGEARAREALARISTLFQGVLPDGLACKLHCAPSDRGLAPTQPLEFLKESA